MDAQDIVSEMVGGVAFVLITGLVIYSLLVLGNVFSSLPGGAAAQSTTNYGILAMGAIVTISGLVGLIKFMQWVSEAFESVGI